MRGDSPLAADRVDVLVSVFVLFLLEDPLEGLREARRVLRPGGSIGTVTWGGDLTSEALGVWDACLEEFGPDQGETPARAAGRDRVDRADKMKDLLTEAGFHDVHAFEEELETRIELERLIGMRTVLGSPGARFRSLAREAQEECLVRARARLAAQETGAFVARANLVYGVGA